MKILFVHPESYLNNGIPGGISILGAILKRHGHQVRVFDTTFLKVKPDRPAGNEGDAKEEGANAFQPHKKTAYDLVDLVENDPVVRYDEEFQKMIDAFQPKLIAISSMTTTFDFALELLRSVRYQAKIIVGGVHATIAADDCLAQKEIDIVCVGEGDDVFPELCDLMEQGKDYTTTKSMCFKMPDGSIKRNPPAPRVDLNTLPCPDWSLFDERHLFRPFDGNIYTGSFYSQSRGCPNLCTYCINWTVSELTGGMKGYSRRQSPAVTISHVKELKEKYSATWFKFSDDSFLLPPVPYMEDLRDGLKSLSIQFGCSVMPLTITREKVAIATDMGCVAMSMGVESGNPGIRKLIRRNYDNDELVEKVKVIIDAGIRLSTFNIIGFPGETRENVFETIELNRRLGVQACNTYILFPYPGTTIQREYNIPLRGADGKILPLKLAKEFGLSKMSPAELEGLLRTFNLYRILPKTEWPRVKMAEEASPAGNAILRELQQFATAMEIHSDSDRG